MALDLAHSRPHKSLAKNCQMPFDYFLKESDFVIRNCPSNVLSETPPVRVKEGDARRLKFKDNSIDLVITSPPYLNAIDYIRCSKFTLVWMGYNVEQLTDVRKISIGTEVGSSPDADEEISDVLSRLRADRLPARRRAIIASYIRDMRAALTEIHRVLVPDGEAVLVVGENTVGGFYIANAVAITVLARKIGLHLVKRSRRELPPNRRYLPPPTRGLTDLSRRMRAEVVLKFQKSQKTL